MHFWYSKDVRINNTFDLEIGQGPVAVGLVHSRIEAYTTCIIVYSLLEVFASYSLVSFDTLALGQFIFFLFILGF